MGMDCSPCQPGPTETWNQPYCQAMIWGQRGRFWGPGEITVKFVLLQRCSREKLEGAGGQLSCELCENGSIRAEGLVPD